MTDRPMLLRVRDIQVALGLSRGTVYALLTSGNLPSIKIGRSRRVLASDLDAWVLARKEEASLPE